jgi:uncharacterized membrane protein
MMNVRAWQGGYGMASPNYGFMLISILFAIVILIDLVFVGIWLWKQISKK